MDSLSLNVAVYILVKFIGYSLFAFAVNKIYNKTCFPIKFGLLKTCGGLLVGFTTYGLIQILKHHSFLCSFVWFVGYLPLRALVWYLVLYYCYGKLLPANTIKKLTLIGIVYSIALDGFVFLLFVEVPLFNIGFC